MQPFEAYLISKEAAVNAPKLYSIGGIGGEITGIEELPSDALDGIEIYVRYGVLYIKSDRERTLSIYDTAGHMVRQVEVQEGTTAVTGLGKASICWQEKDSGSISKLFVNLEKGPTP